MDTGLSAAGAALVAAVLLAGVQTHRLAVEQKGHADTKRAHAEQIATLEQAARQAEADARAEERRRHTELEKIANETRDELEQARTDATTAAAAGTRLRQRIASLTASCRGPAGDPGAAAGSPSARAAADLLADVQRRLDDAADGIARHADAAGAAGRACERTHDAMTESAAR